MYDMYCEIGRNCSNVDENKVGVGGEKGKERREKSLKN